MATTSELVRRLRALSMKVAKLEFVAQCCSHEVNSLLELATWLDEHSPPRRHAPAPLHVGRFIVNRAAFSICDGTRICELGNTVCFRFFECLASEPDRCFTMDQLLATVWDGQRRAATTVRSAIFDLRSQLRQAGMGELADAIRSDGRAYCLRFNGPAEIAQRKSNR